MTTTTDISFTEQPAGCFSRVIVFISGSYLLIMIAYLILRLIFFGGLWWLALLNAFAIYTFAPLLVLLPLALLAGRWRMLIRLGLLAVLAVIWFGPFFQANNVESTGAPTIIIATFNLEQDRGGFLNNLDPFNAWLDENEVDILVLQETPEGLIDADGATSLLETYPEHYIQTIDEAGGLRRAIFSRYPLDDIVTGDRYLRAVIDFNGTNITLYNVHFEWPFRNDPRFNFNTGSPWINLLLKYDETIRNEQIDAFLELIADETTPYIVAGDFNTSQHSIIYSSLAVAMDDSFRATSSGLGATWPSERFGALVPTVLRIDYVWYSEPLKAIGAAVGPHFGSDHLPYVATLELRRSDE